MNILAPIMKNATALVGQNTMAINYSSLNYDSDRTQMLEVCEKLNRYAATTWERLKMDKYQWDILQDAYVAGDSFAYFYDDNGYIAMEIIDNTNIMFADEQNPDIQEQPYILIIQRKYVSDVRKEAEDNDIASEDISRIVADDDTDLQINGDIEVKNDKKLTVIMKMYREDDGIYIARSTKNVIYQKPIKIEGLTLYPIAHYSWKNAKGSARGLGDIWDKIPNQISINRNLYRFEFAVKTGAYPHKVFNSSALSASEVQKLDLPGSSISVNDSQGQSINNLITYLQPANISPYAKDIWQEMIKLTRELSGAGDNLENINPEQASGTAINAAREAKSLSVNMQVAAFKQFIEDIALILYDLWVTYNPNGLEIPAEDEEGNEYLEVIPAELLAELKIDVRIDVSPTNPYSKLAQELGLKELLQTNMITFEEYVQALDDDSNLPKAKLEEIIEARQERQQEMEMLQAQAQQGQQASQKLMELTSALQMQEGGETDEYMQYPQEYGAPTGL